MSIAFDHTVAVSPTVAPRDWEEIRHSLSGSFYLSTAFAHITASEGQKPLYFRYVDGSGKCQGIALGFLSSPWNRTPLRVLFRNLEFRTHPIVINGAKDILNDFSSRIVQFGKKLHVTAVKFGSEDALISSTGLDTLGMIPHHRIEFLIQLDRTDDELIDAMHHMRKRNLKKLTKKKELVVFEDNTENGLRNLIRLQTSSRDRRRQRGEDYDIGSDQYISYVVNQYLKPGYGRLFFATMTDDPIAGVFLHCDTCSAYYTRAGSSPEGFQIGASQFLVWEMMRRLRNDGYKILNLGGVPANSNLKGHPAHGLYFFKSSYGSKQIRCITWTLENVGIQSKLAAWLLKKM
ncbi:MAG: GNAT family N-acetyltransferase [Deltaproteobacteria bacterium]|nr:GNAT family N-acetyltransferase [Deltaproteobacteria bacterium]